MKNLFAIMKGIIIGFAIFLALFGVLGGIQYGYDRHYAFVGCFESLFYNGVDTHTELIADCPVGKRGFLLIRN